MKKMFPTMLDSPDTRALAFGIPYWILAFFVFPAIISLSTITSRGQDYEIWFEIGYHLLNFILVIFFFFPYLRDAFLLVQVNTKEVLGTAAVCASLIVVLKLVAWIVAVLSGSTLIAQAAFGSLLTTETDLLFYSTAVLCEQPLWGTLCLGILAPITTCCLLYASVFAPICTTRPWLAYLVMTALFLLMRLTMALCLWPMEEELAIFLVQLPVHLIACWAYEKTDTVWTPILIHILVNLAMALIVLCIIGIL